MNQEQFMGLVRVLVPSIVTYCVGKGWIPVGQAADVGAGLIAIALAGWSVWSNRDSAKLKAVTSMPEVQKIVVAPTADPASAAAQAATDRDQPKVTKS